jgi:hypothetical protein
VNAVPPQTERQNGKQLWASSSPDVEEVRGTQQVHHKEIVVERECGCRATTERTITHWRCG